MQHDRAVTCRFLRRSIDRNEYKGLLEFLTAKGLKIRNLVETAAAENEARKRAMGLDGSSSDDEMPQRGPADSNDEDSPDEDFVAPKDDSSDDDDDDDDEDGSGSDDNEEEAKPKKKKVVDPSEPLGKWAETIVKINRVQKVVRGGTIMRYRALVVVGNLMGAGGFAYGKGHSPRCRTSAADMPARGTPCCWQAT